MNVEDRERLSDFDRRFEELTAHPPFGWQRRLFKKYFKNGRLPSALDLPTGLGKTSVMAIWYLALKSGAPVPRRLVYVVDRRAVVDQATTVAERIKEESGDGELRISTLRGQYADNRKWLEDPTAPAIIVGTVDMIGSRLLFEGYGVSRRMRPYHAGLLGADTLLVLDESHLVPPFEHLLDRIARDRDEDNDFGPKEERDCNLIPHFRLLPLSATGRNRGGDVFQLIGEDRKEPLVKARLNAEKHLIFKPIDNRNNEREPTDKTDNGRKPNLETRLAEEAWALSGEGKEPVRILIYCNSRKVAKKTKAEIENRLVEEAWNRYCKSRRVERKTKKEIEKQTKLAGNVQLFVGSRRVKEREDAKKKLEELGFFSGNNSPESAAFVIATSAGEVGVDLDADHIVMDIVPFERMVQRLGRVNRLGGAMRKACIIVIEEFDKDLPDDLKERAEKTAGLLRKLERCKDDIYNANPGNLNDLKSKLGTGEIVDASSPDPLYPALTRPLLDAWSMTSLKEHTGRPEVHPWLRGWVADDPPQTTLVWRKYLPVRVQGGKASEREVADFFTAAPPHLTEKLETESHHVYDCLKKRMKKLLDRAEESRKTDREGTPEKEKRLGKDDIIAFVLGSGNEADRHPLKLAELDEALQNKNAFLSSIAGRTIILDTLVGGLSEDGLLDEECDTPVPTADEDRWRGAEKEQSPLTPFRVRYAEVKHNEDEELMVTSEPRDSGGDWHPVFAFDIKRNHDGNPQGQLIIEKWRDQNPEEDVRSVARRAQSLSEHQDWAAKRVKELVNRLELQSELGNAIVIAARLHDEGKTARHWQDAFHTKRDGRPYAKTGSQRAPNFGILGGYRHEFGSLSHLDSNNEFDLLSHEMKDLVRHLIAAHHGRARPVIETVGCEDAPPSLLEARARDVALRFARLQKRFGPWGLAWLESILRAADQQASRDLDEGRTPDG